MALYPAYIPIILAQANPFDYETFLQTCRTRELPLISRNTYLEGVRALIPNKPAPIVTTAQGKSPRSCCGGGTVR